MINESSESAAILRRARPEDLGETMLLLERAGLPTAGVSDWFDRFVVAGNADRIVGVAGLEVYGSDGLLRSVAVAKEWRGRGIGGTLIEAVIARAIDDGLTAMYLLTETAPSYFPRHGFSIIAREDASQAVRASAEFTELCPTSSIVMMRSLVA